MRIVPLALADACLIEPVPFQDERGLFARTFCAREFAEAGLETRFVQCSTSHNIQRGTLRGLHYQDSPSVEIKLVRCTAGAIWDVIVDLRPESPTYLQHISIELSAQSRRALYIPARFAHGFQTLQPNAEVFYQMSDVYAPELSRGLRHDDPRLGIEWPLAVTAISVQDREWPFL